MFLKIASVLIIQFSPQNIRVFTGFRYGLLAFLRANAEPPRFAAGSQLFAFPVGVEQAFAPIYINGAKNTCFFRILSNLSPIFFLINTPVKIGLLKSVKNTIEQSFIYRYHCHFKLHLMKEEKILH